MKGETPSIGLISILPLVSPQSALVTPVVTVKEGSIPINTVATASHPFASVTVTSYIPKHKPVSTVEETPAVGNEPDKPVVQK